MDAAGLAPQTINGNSRSLDHQVPSQVFEALQAIYDPHSSNDTRRQATEYLEQAKRTEYAPVHGESLAGDREQPAQVRHYGLTMLEYAIKYSWDDFDAQYCGLLRSRIVELAQATTADDPVYLRNKTAQLWCEVAKREWGAEWLDMDMQLVQLWNNSLHHQQIVLYVLESLAEECFYREDPTVGLRGSELGRACVDIFTPLEVLQEQLPSRDQSLQVRCGDEGWLHRLKENLERVLTQGDNSQERVQTAAVKTMATLRAAMPWVMPRAVSATGVVEALCKALAAPVVEIQLAAIEVLQAIYSRHHLQDDEFNDLVAPMLTTESVSLLRAVYDWTVADMDVNDLDDQKYALCKRLSEFANRLGLFIDLKPEVIPETSDLDGLFRLLYEIMRNPSLFVSIPALDCWTKLLRSTVVRNLDVVNSLVGGLLGTCCERLLRYESLPEETQDLVVQFLNIDVDTVPERHAFLGNYRRFCVDVIEVLVLKTPVEAIEHILGQATTMLQNLYTADPPFKPETFTRNSPPVLRVDAQITVIDAALKGYAKWLTRQGESIQDDERKRDNLENLFENWGRQILQARFEDPEIARKIISLLSNLSTKALGDRPTFALEFLEYMLTIRLADDTSFRQYSESVKDLERISSLEMQRLAMKFPDDFMNVYDQLDRVINDMINNPTTDERQRKAYSAFLFIIIHRCTTLDSNSQEQRLRSMLDQVRDAWRGEDFGKAISGFSSFCEVLGMGHLPDFLAANRFSAVQDWANQPLGSEGQALQASILERSQLLPLRLTKTLLSASTEKLRDGSQAFETAARLWAEVIPVLLPNLLQLINYAQAFNDIDSSWSHLPIELQRVVRRMLTDRFWQSGISTESRDDFFARVSGSKTSFEGFASSVRGTVRHIRESSYFILYSLTRFRDSFYGIQDLPDPLSHALFDHAHALTAHHLSVLLTVSTHLIERCPPHLRPQFLPAMIQGLFRELNRKVATEWEEVAKQVAGAAGGDSLTDEMKTESILRQLTCAAVSLVVVLLDPRHELIPKEGDQRRDPNQSLPPMHTFVLSTPSVLEPILLFANTCLQVRDTRSVFTTIRTIRSILPHFKHPSPIRDYITNEMLKSAITSLHDPYFVETQKDLASLIAGIITLDLQTTRAILLSLPGMTDASRVEKRLSRLVACNGRDERTQRSIVLELLAEVRGVGIHEMGKIQRAAPKKRSKFEEQYMSVDAAPTTIVRGTSPTLAGVADMFGGGET